jgi:hypothetical protein
MLTRLALAALSVAAVAATAAPAHAVPTPTPVAGPYVSPLSVAVAPDGTRYFSDNFAGLLYKQTPGAAPTVIFKGPKKAEVGAVSAVGGQVRFAVSQGNNEKGDVYTLDAAGNATKILDTAKAERRRNPDFKTRYGLRGLKNSCLIQLGPDVSATYYGIEETHPYATTAIGATTYVADAGANAVFSVSPTEGVKSYKIPALVTKMTKKAAKSMGLPKCTVGKKFVLESVPTDIEAGPDGALYVTSLPGGPEDGSLGAQGRVLRLDPTTGAVTTVVQGLVSPTGLAVAPTGDLYVAQLFAGNIVKVAAGSGVATPYVALPMPADVEWTPTGLVATQKALPGKKPKGEIVTIAP